MTHDNKVTAANIYAQRGPGPPLPPAQPSKPNPWVRVAVAVVLVPGFWFGLLVVCHVVGLLDWRLGRFAIACAAGGAVVIALFVAVKRTGLVLQAAYVLVGIAAGTAFTSFAVSQVEPGYWALRAEFHRIPDPPGWSSRNERANGNRICFDVCKSIERELLPDTDDPPRAEQRIRQLLELRGYRLISNDENSAVFRKGKFEITYSYSDGQPSPGSIYQPQPARWELQIEAA